MKKTKTEDRTSPALPTVNFLIKINNFVDLRSPAKGESHASTFELEMCDRHPNVALESEKSGSGKKGKLRLRVKNGGAVLRFTVRDEEGGHGCRPTALTFIRHDAKTEVPVFPNAGNQTGEYSPFSKVEFNGPVVQVAVTLQPNCPAYRGIQVYTGILSLLCGARPTIVFMDYFENENET